MMNISEVTIRVSNQIMRRSLLESDAAIEYTQESMLEKSPTGADQEDNKDLYESAVGSEQEGTLEKHETQKDEESEQYDDTEEDESQTGNTKVATLGPEQLAKLKQAIASGKVYKQQIVKQNNITYKSEPVS